jgi:hypothetical protein
MPLTVEQALTEASLFSDGVDYTLIQLPSGAIMAAAGIIAEIGEAFCALIVDKDEVSLIIPAEALADFAPRLPGHKASSKPYRLITFDIPLDLDLVGFMARVSTALAGAGISIMPLAAYSRDHLLVPAEQFQNAITVLQQLKSNP